MKVFFKASLLLAAVLIITTALSSTVNADRVDPSALGPFRKLQMYPESTEGQYQQFVFIVEHGYSHSDIKVVNILIGETKDSLDALYLQVYQDRRIRVGGSGRLNLGIQTGQIGGDKVIENSKVIIDLKRSQVTLHGQREMRISIFLDFRDKEFSGRHNVFMEARDLQDQSSGYHLKGEYTVESVEDGGNDPEWIRVLPRDEEGRDELFTFIVEDKDGADDITFINISFVPDRLAYYFTQQFWIYPNKREIRMFGGGVDRLARFGADTKLSSRLAKLHLSESSIQKDRLDKRYIIKLKLSFSDKYVGDKAIEGDAHDTSGRRTGKKEIGKYLVAYTKSAPHPMFMLPNKAVGSGETPGSARVPVVFSTWWRDSDGIDDIKNLEVKFSKDSGTDDGEVVYFKTNIKNAWLINGEGQIEYSRFGKSESEYAILDGEYSKVHVIDDKTLRIELGLRFKETFQGKWKIYLRGEDYSGNRKGWRRLGKYTVRTGDSRPSGRRVLPFFNTGKGQSFMFEFRDRDGANDIRWAEATFRPQSGDDSSYGEFTFRYIPADNSIRVFINRGRTLFGTAGEDEWVSDAGVSVDLSRTFALYFKDRIQVFTFLEFDTGYIWGLKDVVLYARDYAGKESINRVLGGYRIQE